MSNEEENQNQLKILSIHRSNLRQKVLQRHSLHQEATYFGILLSEDRPTHF